MPIQWFLRPVQHALRKTVRPPTTRTRRKWFMFKSRVPRQVLESLLAGLTEADVKGLEWTATTTSLVPTKKTAALHHYK